MIKDDLCLFRYGQLPWEFFAHELTQPLRNAFVDKWEAFRSNLVSYASVAASLKPTRSEEDSLVKETQVIATSSVQVEATPMIATAARQVPQSKVTAFNTVNQMCNQIAPRDFQSLFQKQWLNDQIVYYLLKIQTLSLPNVFVIDPQNDLKKNVYTKQSLEKYDIFLYPCNIDNVHWIGIAASRKNQSYGIFDSLGLASRYSSQNKSFGSRFCDFIRNRAGFKRGSLKKCNFEVPLQSDSHSCGMHTIENLVRFAKLQVTDAAPFINPCSIEQWRNLWQSKILKEWSLELYHDSNFKSATFSHLFRKHFFPIYEPVTNMLTGIEGKLGLSDQPVAAAAIIYYLDAVVMCVSEEEQVVIGCNTNITLVKQFLPLNSMLHVIDVTCSPVAENFPPDWSLGKILLLVATSIGIDLRKVSIV